MTISDRKLRSIHRKKVEPVLDQVADWSSVDEGSESSAWVAAAASSRPLVQRSRATLERDLAAHWTGTRRAALVPLAKVVGQLVDKVDRPVADARREMSSTVYEMH